MALFVNQNGNSRSKLQERLAAELSEKAKKKALLDAQVRPDGVEDSNFVRDTKSTTGLAWVWILIVFFVVAASVAYMILAG